MMPLSSIFLYHSCKREVVKKRKGEQLANLESLWFWNLLFCRVAVEDVVVPFTGRTSPDVGHCVA